MKVIADVGNNALGYITVRNPWPSIKPRKFAVKCPLCNGLIETSEPAYQMYVKSLSSAEKVWAFIHAKHILKRYEGEIFQSNHPPTGNANQRFGVSKYVPKSPEPG